MKIDDVVALLADRINQAHYLKFWFGRVFNAGVEHGKPKWIPVSERLPEFGKTEETAYHSEWVHCSNGKAVFLQAYQYCKGIGFVPYGSPNPDYRVTHWMRLSDAPEKSKP